jgi:hypothetical protein
MITAQEARDLMPKTEKILVKIENVIRHNAEKGLTSCVYDFGVKEFKTRPAVLTQLFAIGYSVSLQSPNSIKISWRKL